MHSTNNHTLKILLTDTHISDLDIRNIEGWENEGGASNPSSFFGKPILPLRQGDIFEVRNGDISYEDGKLLFIIEVALLARDY